MLQESADWGAHRLGAITLSKLSRVRFSFWPLCVLLSGCDIPQARVQPSIKFSSVPPSGVGSPDKLYPIAGSVTGARPGERVVLFARSGIWWVQPIADQPFTAIRAGTNWESMTHPGSAYAALLVDSEYRPPMTLEEMPVRGGHILAVTIAEGTMLSKSTPRTIHFGGYEWEVRQAASDRGGTRNRYDAENAWIDDNGFLHLRIAKREGEWTSAEVSLQRSWGYGSYRFVVRDISHLEPAAVFSVFTWDDTGQHREMDLEISRWGESGGKNAQYVIQPYYVPANAVRFVAPPGPLTHTLVWAPGRAAFRTVRGSAGSAGEIVDEHTFTSGVPSPGSETIHMNLYRFGNETNPLRRECEVVIEKFEYLP